MSEDLEPIEFCQSARLGQGRTRLALRGEELVLQTEQEQERLVFSQIVGLGVERESTDEGQFSETGAMKALLSLRGIVLRFAESPNGKLRGDGFSLSGGKLMTAKGNLPVSEFMTRTSALTLEIGDRRSGEFVLELPLAGCNVFVLQELLKAKPETASMPTVAGAMSRKSGAFVPGLGRPLYVHRTGHRAAILGWLMSFAILGVSIWLFSVIGLVAGVPLLIAAVGALGCWNTANTEFAIFEFGIRHHSPLLKWELAAEEIADFNYNAKHQTKYEFRIGSEVTFSFAATDGETFKYTVEKRAVHSADFTDTIRDFLRAVLRPELQDSRQA
jgi:hypothetical protein